MGEETKHCCKGAMEDWRIPEKGVTDQQRYPKSTNPSTLQLFSKVNLIVASGSSIFHNGSKAEQGSINIYNVKQQPPSSA